MELKKLSEHIWYMTYEEKRDRPNLGYVKGDNWSLAIDAGHSDTHVNEFYALLEKEGLPLPDLTVLTHWHWDHTFAMYAVHGLCLANKRTNEYLVEWKNKIEKEGPSEFLSITESIREEYAGNKEVIVVPSDMVFEGEMTLDSGRNGRYTERSARSLKRRKRDAKENLWITEKSWEAHLIPKCLCMRRCVRAM